MSYNTTKLSRFPSHVVTSNQNAAFSWNSLLYSQLYSNKAWIQWCKIWINWRNKTSIHWMRSRILWKLGCKISIMNRWINVRKLIRYQSLLDRFILFLNPIYLFLIFFFFVPIALYGVLFPRTVSLLWWN